MGSAFAASAWCTALSSCRCTVHGRALMRRPSVRASDSCARPRIAQSDWRTIESPSCTNCAARSRTQEWTDAMTSWCARQPDGVGFRGQCLVHRAELMQVHGAWSSAHEEAERARERFMRPPAHRAVGLAYYRIAELHQLRGEIADAGMDGCDDLLVREAAGWGRLSRPVPGAPR